MNKEYHYLCSPSQKYTDLLYGDDVSKHVKEIQDINRMGSRMRGRYPVVCARGRFPLSCRVMKRGRGRVNASMSRFPKKLSRGLQQEIIVDEVSLFEDIL